MTFSIVARCPRTGQFGVAAATAMPAVGKLLSHAAAGAGAVATQAQVNPYLGLDGLALLREGHSAPAALKRLMDSDPCMQLRQFLLGGCEFGLNGSYLVRELLNLLPYGIGAIDHV